MKVVIDGQKLRCTPRKCLQRDRLRPVCAVNRDTDISFCKSYEDAEETMYLRARRLLMTAAQRGRVCIGIAGIPGSGKTTAANALIQRCYTISQRLQMCCKNNLHDREEQL
jgi:pantothenate kinase